MANLFARGVHAAWLASLKRPTQRFQAAVRDPEATQRRRLQAVLARNTQTAYGIAHEFKRVGTVADWQERVPTIDYDTLAPWVERIGAGESGVLTRDEVLMLEPTAGTSGSPKLIPYTESLLEELMAATGPWLFGIYRAWPALLGTRSYWSAAGARRTAGKTEGGVPVGATDDSAYFGPIEGWANARVTAGESLAAAPPNPEDPLNLARRLLEADDLGFISVWSPSSLTDLVTLIEAHLDSLLDDLSSARATNLRGAVTAAGRVTLPALWPSLALVSCWADAPSKDALANLMELLPGTPVQPKGLLTTEGVVSVPMGAEEGALAAVASHFLEFLDVETPDARPMLVHEVREGARYTPILTTSGGLYRYRLTDIVRCVGHTEATPRFVVEGPSE